MLKEYSVNWVAKGSTSIYANSDDEAYELFMDEYRKYLLDVWDLDVKEIELIDYV